MNQLLKISVVPVVKFLTLANNSNIQPLNRLREKIPALQGGPKSNGTSLK